MKKFLWALLLNLALLVPMASAQTVTVVPIATGSQVADAVAFQAVLAYMGASTNATLAEKAARINFLSPASATDLQSFEAEVNSFEPQYATAIAAEANAYAQNPGNPTLVIPSSTTVASNAASILQNELSSTGYTQWHAFVESEKVGMTTYGITGVTQSGPTTYTTMTPIDIGDPDASYDDYGDEIAYTTYPPTCNFYPHGTAIVTSAPASGTGTPSESLRSADNTTTKSYLNTGTITTGTYSFTFYLTGNVCSPQYIKFTIPFREEIANTMFRNTGGTAHKIGTENGDELWAFPVGPFCTNTGTPDYDVPAVDDTENWSYWDTLAACISYTSPSGSHGPWGCIPFVQNGLTTAPPVPCTHNP